MQVAYKNAIAVAFHTIYWHKTQKHFSNVLSNSSVYIISCIRQPVAQELDKIHVLVYMHASFVDLLQESVSQSKVAARLRLNVCWCISEACKYKKRNHNNGHDDSLLNCSCSWLEKSYCSSCTYSIEIFTNAFARTFYEQMVAFIQSRNLDIY